MKIRHCVLFLVLCAAVPAPARYYGGWYGGWGCGWYGPGYGGWCRPFFAPAVYTPAVYAPAVYAAPPAVAPAAAYNSPGAPALSSPSSAPAPARIPSVEVVCPGAGSVIPAKITGVDLSGAPVTVGLGGAEAGVTVENPDPVNPVWHLTGAGGEPLSDGITGRLWLAAPVNGYAALVVENTSPDGALHSSLYVFNPASGHYCRTRHEYRRIIVK